MSELENNLPNEDSVPVTGAFLSLVGILHGYRTVFINETHLAESLGHAAPEDYFSRCEKLFLTTYAAQVDQIGLCRNRITFESIMHLEVADEVKSTDFDQLPKKFFFNPWVGMTGGIVRVGA